MSTCPECSGRGTISFGQGSFAVNRPCPQCRGRGKIPSEKCPTCRGAGEVRTERRINITVPPGAETGARILLRGQGQPSRPGGPPGDLIITFKVQPHHFFRRVRARDRQHFRMRLPHDVAVPLLYTALGYSPPVAKRALAVLRDLDGFEPDIISDILEKFYNLILTDCGTGIVHSVMRATLQRADLRLAGLG